MRKKRRRYYIATLHYNGSNYLRVYFLIGYIIFFKKEEGERDQSGEIIRCYIITRLATFFEWKFYMSKSEWLTGDTVAIGWWRRTAIYLFRPFNTQYTTTKFETILFLRMASRGRREVRLVSRVGVGTGVHLFLYILKYSQEILYKRLADIRVRRAAEKKCCRERALHLMSRYGLPASAASMLKRKTEEVAVEEEESLRNNDITGLLFSKRRWWQSSPPFAAVIMHIDYIQYFKCNIGV